MDLHPIARFEPAVSICEITAKYSRVDSNIYVQPEAWVEPAATISKINTKYPSVDSNMFLLYLHSNLG